MLFQEIVCPICGKKFLVAPQHIYKVSTYGLGKGTGGFNLVCSWTCQLKGERAHEERKAKAKEKRAQKKK